MASGFFGQTLDDLLDGSLATLALESETGIKTALYNATGVSAWNFNGTGASASYTATNEISGTGYTAKGVALAGTEVTFTAGVLTYDANDAAWSGATLSGVRGCTVLDDAVTTPNADPILVGVDFDSDYAVTAGTFTVQWAAGGICTIDYVP